MILYHGSKSGLKGPIRSDAGRKTCDFGAGFYTGDRKEQPVSLVAGYSSPVLYTLECDLDSGLRVLRFGGDYDSRMDWALFVAYNRGLLDFSGYPALIERFKRYNSEYDVIVGTIVNDRMTIALNLFYRGILCDKALLNALEYVSLGNQFVFKTPESCAEPFIRIADTHVLTEKEKNVANIRNEQVIRMNNNLMEQLQTRYRRAKDVLYYDEVLQQRGR